MLLPITKLDSCPIGKYVQNIQEWGIPPVTHVTGQNRFYYWTNYSWSHETRNWAMGIDNRINSSWIPCWMWWSKQRHPKEQKLPIINPSKLNCKQSFNWRTDMTSPWPYIKAHKSRPRLCYMYLADTSWIRLYILEHLFRDWPQECLYSKQNACVWSCYSDSHDPVDISYQIRLSSGLCPLGGQYYHTVRERSILIFQVT